MTLSLDRLRRLAKDMRKAALSGDADARAVLSAVAPGADAAAPKLADCLHAVARQHGFASWPRLKAAADAQGLDRAAALVALRQALHHGNAAQIDALSEDLGPDAAAEDFALALMLADPAAEAALGADPGLATRALDGRPPLVHLAMSRVLRVRPDREAAQIDLAGRLVARGADVNAPWPWPGDGSPLSPLYFALGHAGNLPLARWLLEQGADPNDGESLYHATELGHADGVKLLLEHGADPAGTNALARAMDFDDAGMVRLLLAAGASPNEGADGAGQEGRVPALHQAARRQCSGPVIDALLAAGADPALRWQGVTAYALARVHGNRTLAERLEAAGPVPGLSEDEALLAAAAEGRVPEGRWIDPARLPEIYRNLVREILHLPGKLPHLEALARIGIETDRPDAEGLTPLHVAGWEGLPEVTEWVLRQRPDLSHVNGYGGSWLSTIVHGSENNPHRAERDFVACARIALEQGVALPRRMPGMARDPELAGFLADWAEAHPGQVVEHGIA